MSKLLLAMALLLPGCYSRVACYEAVGMLPRNLIILNKCEGELFLAEVPVPQVQGVVPPEQKTEL